jgi:hypothetical protein
METIIESIALYTLVETAFSEDPKIFDDEGNEYYIKDFIIENKWDICLIGRCKMTVTLVDCDTYKNYECLLVKRAFKDYYYRVVIFDDNKKIKEDVMTSDDYLKAHRNSGIEVGDTVKVLRRATEGEQGWNNKWCTDMDSFIGKEFEVFEDDGVFGFSIEVGVSEYNFPWFVLEIIKKKNQCPIDLDDLNFGCVDKKRVEEILNIYLKEKNFYKARQKAVEGLGRYGWAGSAVLNLMDELDFANITTDEFIIVKKLLGRIFKEIKNGNK